jgi:hypothetical protein
MATKTGRWRKSTGWWLDQKELRGTAPGDSREPEDVALEPGHPTEGTSWRDAAVCGFLLVTAFLIATYKASSTGALWPDAPRYSNAAAMIHDWLVSGDLLHPYEFAKKNYCQYPAFNIPFHPPIYPALLGLFFTLTGVSYLAARAFVGLCLGGSACLFYAILRQMQVSRSGCLLSALLLVTMPEIAHWSRDTMSEVPGLVFILAGSHFFLRWLRTARPGSCWTAFACAELAFLCRVTTVGVLPGWFLFGLLTRRFRQVFSPHALGAALLYLILNGGYIWFAAQFGQYEVAADGRARGFSWESLSYFSTCLSPLLLTGSAGVGLAGLCCACWRKTPPLVVQFWLCWILSYTLFKIAVPTTPELRHFFGALPGVAGLAAGLFSSTARASLGRRGGIALCGLGLAVNAWQGSQLPQGIVGYEAVAQQLAALEKPGNVLLACWEEQDLIFRYRAQDPRIRRLLIRSDRTLAIRLSGYAKVQVERMVHSSEEVREILRRGRVRYLVTCLPNSAPEQDNRFEEVVVAHETALASPQAFALLTVFPWYVDYGGTVQSGKIFLWEVQEEYPDDLIDLPIVIPTANLRLSASS